MALMDVLRCWQMANMLSMIMIVRRMSSRYGNEFNYKMKMCVGQQDASEWTVPPSLTEHVRIMFALRNQSKSVTLQKGLIVSSFNKVLMME